MDLKAISGFLEPGYWRPKRVISGRPGYWGYQNSAYVWNPGYWGPQVGYYGGIDYGYGYPGNGYQGGYWQNRQFYYNRNVNNVTINNVHVYNRTVVNNVNVTRVSYNGGQGGVGARPTPQQESAMRARHVEATNTQMQHEQAARQNRELYASVNHGRPAIAATPKPTSFRGRSSGRRNQPVNTAATQPHPNNAPRPNERVANTARPNENSASEREERSASEQCAASTGARKQRCCAASGEPTGCAQ